MSVMKTPHRDELLAAVDTPVYLGQPGLPLDITGMMPKIMDAPVPKVVLRKCRTLNIALRNNPAAFRITGEDTEEWRDEIAVFRQAWALFHANAREDNFVGTHTIRSEYDNCVQVLSVRLDEVVLMTEAPTS